MVKTKNELQLGNLIFSHLDFSINDLKKLQTLQAGNLAVLVKTAGESMGLREAMYVFFPGFIAVSKTTSSLFVTNHPLH